MSDFSVSKRYASAFMGVTREKNLSTPVAEDMKLIFQTISNSKELLKVLKSPIIKQDIKINILDELFGKHISKETKDFLNFIIGKDREELIHHIAKCYIDIYDFDNGIVNAELKSAFELDETYLSSIKNKIEFLTGKKIRLKSGIDNSLIGGFSLKIKDTVYDASAKRQLELLKKQLLTEN